MHNWHCDTHSITIDSNKACKTISGLTLREIPVNTKGITFRYRFLRSGYEAWQDLVWSKVKKDKDILLYSGVCALGRHHKYNIALSIKNREFAIEQNRFSGLALQFSADKVIPWAGEIECSLPLSGSRWRYYIQDRDSTSKDTLVTKGWKGTCLINWQAQRSPFDFMTTTQGVLLSRISTLSQMFSSKAEYVPGKGLVCTYKFTFESSRKWKSSELAFLFLKKKLSERKKKDLWAEIFLTESERFRKQIGVKREEVLPMANFPIDGGTLGCAPLNKLKIEGSFEEFVNKAIPLCKKLGFKRILVGSPWISHRTEGIWTKCTSGITYDSRCATIDFKISPKYGGEKSFRIFCDKAHAHGIEVFVWYPGFHLSNHSPYLTEHPEWIMRKADGSPETRVYFHITPISPRYEVQKQFLENLKKLKKSCGFDGLWLDSFNISFGSLDFSRKQGISGAKEAAEMVKRYQEIGYKVINEGFSPFGARGDGEALFFKGQEDMALDTTIFAYYTSLRKILKNDSYFRFLANKAPLTIAAKYIPKGKMKRVAAWNMAYNKVVQHMIHRELLGDDHGVLWTDNSGSRKILFSYKNGNFKLKKRAKIINIITGERFVEKDLLRVYKGQIYRIIGKFK